MHTAQFRGLWTALITPFTAGDGISNPVDSAALGRLIDLQISGSVDGILFLGTTGENPTLTDDEGESIVRYGIEKIAWRVKVMVNVGTYSTRASLQNMARYERIDGIDAYLLVNPYYNKPTQEGLFRHFTTLARATTRPIFIYNIKGRSAVNLENTTLLRIIWACPNVIWVKEASGDLHQIGELIRSRPPGFIVLSGDDALTHEVIHMGWDGVISVASNAIPGIIAHYVHMTLDNPWSSLELRDGLIPLFTHLFVQSNPLPVKTYLADRGIITEAFRLPICPMDHEAREAFLTFTQSYSYTQS